MLQTTWKTNKQCHSKKSLKRHKITLSQLFPQAIYHEETFFKIHFVPSVFALTDNCFFNEFMHLPLNSVFLKGTKNSNFLEISKVPINRSIGSCWKVWFLVEISKVPINRSIRYLFKIRLFMEISKVPINRSISYNIEILLGISYNNFRLFRY